MFSNRSRNHFSCLCPWKGVNLLCRFCSNLTIMLAYYFTGFFWHWGNVIKAVLFLGQKRSCVNTHLYPHLLSLFFCLQYCFLCWKTHHSCVLGLILYISEAKERFYMWKQSRSPPFPFPQMVSAWVTEVWYTGCREITWNRLVTLASLSIC